MTEIPIPEGFYIGKLCKKGHEFNESGGSLRYSSCNNCVECSRKKERQEYRKKYYRENRERVKENAKNYRKTHLEARRDYHREYRKANREKILASKREYYLKQKKKRLRESMEKKKSSSE